MKNKAREAWTDNLKRNTYALYLVSRDPRVSLLPKLLLGLVVAYALSPIDLIPDFIPVIGYLDDLLVLPLGIWLAVRLVPKDVWIESRDTAAKRAPELPGSRFAASAIVIVWLLTATGLLLLVGSWMP